MINKFIQWILKMLGIIKEQDIKTTKETIYERKKYMSNSEINFYNILKELENEYNVIPQVNMATIVNKKGSGYRNELFRNIDFAIFSKDFSELLLLIELNDQSHNKINRKDRDLKVKKICNDINVEIMTFYTKYPNEKNYVINRINQKLKKDHF